ncbi:unnamed protein product, partial [Mesorhabditis spiculigera]
MRGVAIAFALLISGVSCLSLKEGDFIHDFLAKYKDPQIQPCDDFYRHVCPRGVDPNETPAGAAVLHFDELARPLVASRAEGLQHVEQHPKDAYGMVLEQVTKNYQRAVEEALRGWASVQNMLKVAGLIQNGQQFVQGLDANKLQSTAGALRTRILSGLKDAKLKQKFKDDRVHGNWTAILDKAQFQLGVGDMSAADQLLDTYDGADWAYKQYLADTKSPPFGNGDDVAARFDEFIMFYDTTISPRLAPHVKRFFQLLAGFDTVTSHYDNKTVVVPPAVLATLYANPKHHAASFYAIFATETAKEVLKMLFKSVDSTQKGYLDGQPLHFRECMRHYFREACILWRADCACTRYVPEGQSMSLSSKCPYISTSGTFEYMAWKEALRLAWELFEKEKPGAAEDVYPDLKINSHQLFYYSHAVNHCLAFPISLEVGAGRTAKGIGRGLKINAAIGADPNFAKAFNCKPRDKMAQSGRCPFFFDDKL